MRKYCYYCYFMVNMSLAPVVCYNAVPKESDRGWSEHGELIKGTWVPFPHSYNTQIEGNATSVHVVCCLKYLCSPFSGTFES